ncbi:DUF6463 family protein [Nocardia mexicana]|uniref:Uncharacterized protein n=1 Tax=Nocardia mexicana TaxID=279262 RepID=A0A370GG46_9NOCA|nr:DUF6463 family protein [Nocardia mexicana]RDI42778.1 hypothetical protein DFR68_12441 [Nocardia mexicana]
MKLIQQRTAPNPTGVRSTQIAGWIAIAFGAIHTLVAPIDTRDTWSLVFSEGWWNTFTLDKATTLAQLERSETFWLTLGSFGVPILLLGCHLVWSARHHHRVPGWIGWLLVIWSLLLITAVPASPAWALLLSGGLITLGDSRILTGGGRDEAIPSAT